MSDEPQMTFKVFAVTLPVARSKKPGSRVDHVRMTTLAIDYEMAQSLAEETGMRLLGQLDVNGNIIPRDGQ